MKSVLAIDPGSTMSAYVIWDGEFIAAKGKLDNYQLLAAISTGSLDAAMYCVIERVACYGMSVGRDVFDTCFWTGRYIEAWVRRASEEPALMERGKVKMHLCQSMRAKDGNIRQALIDRLGAPGTKKLPGRTYGCSNDIWAALALAVTYYDQNHRP
jgi:hypothetical protein